MMRRDRCVRSGGRRLVFCTIIISLSDQGVPLPSTLFRCCRPGSISPYSDIATTGTSRASIVNTVSDSSPSGFRHAQDRNRWRCYCTLPVADGHVGVAEYESQDPLNEAGQDPEEGATSRSSDYLASQRPSRWRRWRHAARGGVTRVLGRALQRRVEDGGPRHNDFVARDERHVSGGKRWRGRSNGGIFANAAAAAPPLDDRSAAGNVDRAKPCGGDDIEEDSGVCSGSEKQRATEYDGEAVPEEAWAKVDELRRRAESCDPNADDTDGLLWWVEGGDDAGGRQGLTDVDLLRFVMFRHGDVDAAWEQLKHAGRWRKEQRADEVLSESEEERWSNFGPGKEEIFWLGRDAGGRPTLVLRSIAHLPGRIDADEFQRYLLYLLEQGRRLWGVGSEVQMNILIDRVGAGRKNQDPRLLATTLPVFRDAYPDVIYRCYVAPTSWIFRFVWIIGARLVDSRQRKRVLLLSKDWQQSLLSDFDPSILPAHLGGTSAEYPPPQPPEM